MSDTARTWHFNRRPDGDIASDTLALRAAPLPTPGEGQCVVRTIYLSLDATNRVWLSDWDIYMDPIRLGDPMRGFLLGEVTESRHPAYEPGQLVCCLGPWSDRFVIDGEALQPFPDASGLPLADAFAILMIAGPTAYVGMLDIGRIEAGDTVVVTAAAGAVGSLAGQIAKLKGCRVIGVAGSDEKCRWLTDDFGFDAAINYRTEDLVPALREKAPDGIDVHFENVGGEVLDAGLTCMNDYGRVVICGLISTYNSRDPVPGPFMFRNVIMRRLTIRGFVILDYADRYPEFHAALLEWMRAGSLRYRLDMVEGLEAAADALRLLYTGGNRGKLMVRIGAEPAQ